MCPDLTDFSTLPWGATARPDAPAGIPGLSPARPGDSADTAVEESFRLALDALAEDLVAVPPDEPATATTARPGSVATADGGGVDPRIQRALDAGKPRHTPPKADFAERLATLTEQLGEHLGELTHEQAKSLLQSAGVRHIGAAHAGSTADAALQAFVGQLIKLPLRLGARSVLMIPTEAGAAARAGTRVGMQPVRGTAAVAVRQATQPLGHVAFFGRSVPSDVLTHLRSAQEKQLKRLIDNLALLQQQRPAAAAPADLHDADTRQALVEQISARLELHDSVEHSAQALEAGNRDLKQISCVRQQTRARMAMAFATLAVDVIAKGGAYAALGGLDLGLLSQMVSLVTYPGMAALTKGICNWYDTKAIAGQMLYDYAHGAGTGEAASPERLQALAHWAQDHFQSAAQAGYHRRDEHVFQPALNDLLTQINECDYELAHLRQLEGARDPAHYHLLKQQHQVQNQINQVNLKFDARHLERDTAAMELLLGYAQADEDALSRDDFKLLVRADAEALLHAQGKQNQSPELKRLFDEFRTAFEAKCGVALTDDDLKLLYKQRLGKAEVKSAADLPASLRPDHQGAAVPRVEPLGRRRAHGPKKNYGLLKDRQKLQLRLDELKAQEAPEAVPAEPVAPAPALDAKRSRIRGRIEALQARREQALVAYLDYQRDVEHYRSGDASALAEDGPVARAIRGHSHGIGAQFRRAFKPDNLKKHLPWRLGMGVALPTVLTATAEGSRLAVRELAEAARDALGEDTRPRAAGATVTQQGAAGEAPSPTDRAGTGSGTQPAASDEPTRGPRLRRSAAASGTPSPSRGWKAEEDAAAAATGRLQSVLAELKLADTPGANTLAASANDGKLRPATSYDDWLTRLKQELAASSARLAGLASQHDSQAGTRAHIWVQLQYAVLMAPTPNPNPGFLAIEYVPTAADRAARRTWERRWQEVTTGARGYLRALREHQDLAQRLREPEQSYLKGLSDAARSEAASQLQPLADFRTGLARKDVTDACMSLGLLPESVHRQALDAMLDRVDEHGRVALMRHLQLLPEALRQPAADTLLKDLGERTPGPALAAAIAVLPEPQRQFILQRLNAPQRAAIDEPSADWPDKAPLEGASLQVARDLSHMQRGPARLRDAYLSGRILARGGQAGFGFDHRQGEPLGLFVKAINSRPAASRTSLACDLIRARMNPVQGASADDLRVLRGQLKALDGVDTLRIERALTEAIASVKEPTQRLAAYDDAMRGLCQSRQTTRVIEDPFAAHPAFNRVEHGVEHIVASATPSESLKSLMNVIPQLPAEQQADRLLKLTDWVRALGGSAQQDVLPHWTSLVGRLKVPDAQRARLLESALRLAGTHYSQDHIGRTLKHADTFLAQMAQALKGMTDGREQLRVFKQLTGLFDLNTSDYWMGTGLNADYTPNEEVTRAYFARLSACVASFAPASQAEAVEHLGRAIRRGSFDTAGCPNGGAARLRLDHFKTLAGEVSRLAPAHRPDAMERLLSQAFPRTRQAMDYQREPFQAWEARNLFEKVVDELLQRRPDGLEVAQERAQLDHLAKTLWPAEWADANSTIGRLMRRLDADVTTRAREQASVDERDATIMRGVDSATHAASGVGGPGKGPAAITRSGRPIVSLEPPPGSTPGQPKPWSLNRLIQSMNSELPARQHPLRVSLEKLQALADKPVNKTIWRMMDGDRNEISTKGLAHVPSGRNYPPGLSEADRRLADIINHTGGSGGSAGAALSFSENRNVPFNFKRKGHNNVLIAVDTTPAPGETDSGFRSTSHILVHDGVRLIKAGAVEAGTVAKAIRKVFEHKEDEVFNVNGRIPPERILPPDSTMPKRPTADASA